MNAEVAIVGAGIVGSACALSLARRGVSVALLEAEAEPGLAASGTNSGILHTGFDSPPGELETDLILRAAELRDPLLGALGVPILRCGALMLPLAHGEHEAVAGLAENARRNGVRATLREDGSLEIPGEAVTDPVALTLALAGSAVRHGAELRTGFRVESIERAGSGFSLAGREGDSVESRLVVNCAGLGAGEIARLAGDRSFDVYPRKGEFLVFDPTDPPLERILLPVPSKGTKGILVFPSLDSSIVAGPTAIDQEDPRDWFVRPQAAQEILPKAVAMFPPLEGVEPVDAYAGLRPAGRGSNYVIEPSRECPGLINAAAIRSTGLTSSVAVAERICEHVATLGVDLGPARPLERGEIETSLDGPWWRRSREYWSA
jgi:glycerol-3-phosphate dehydrogenase